MCQAYRERVNALPTPGNSATPSQQSAFLRAVALAGQQSLTKLQALSPPAGDGPVVQKYIQASEKQVQLVQRAADELDAGQVQQANTTLQVAQQAAPGVRAQARGYGFKVCGSPSGH